MTIIVIAPRPRRGHNPRLEIRIGTGVVEEVAVPQEDLITQTGTEIRIVQGNGTENLTVDIETVPEDNMTGKHKTGIAEQGPLQCLPPNPHQSVSDPLNPEIRHERLNFRPLPLRKDPTTRRHVFCPSSLTGQLRTTHLL